MVVMEIFFQNDFPTRLEYEFFSSTEDIRGNWEGRMVIYAKLFLGKYIKKCNIR